MGCLCCSETSSRQGLPTVMKEKTYTARTKSFAWGGAIVNFVGQNGPFFGGWFGMPGPQNQWPYAVWALCFFLQVTIVSHQSYQHLTETPTTVIRKEDKIMSFNVFGQELSWYTFDASGIKSTAAYTRGCSKGMKLTLTDEEYQRRRECAGCCKRIGVRKNVYLPIVVDYGTMVSDHGFGTDPLPKQVDNPLQV